jgi:serine/threonine-protein kinase
LAWVEFLSRKYDDAIGHLRALLEVDPNIPQALWCLGVALAQKSAFQEAVVAHERAVIVSQRGLCFLAGLAHGYASAGRHDDARNVLAELDIAWDEAYLPPWFTAAAYVALHDHDTAMLWLERAYEVRDPWLPHLSVDPMFDAIRTHPRYHDLLRRMNFPGEPVTRVEPASGVLPTRSLPSPAGEPKSMVVLPFENLSPDPDNEYFADGLTEELISEFTKISALRVISRTSAMRYKGTDKDLPTIGRELNVQFVLEGSVRKAGNNLRITAQLIDATTDSHLWADKHSGTIEDIFAIQERVSRAIVDSLRVTLSPEEEQRIRERPTESLEAYDYYLRGLDSASRGFSRSEYDDAQRVLEAAVQLDPNFAHAYAALSRMHTGMYHLGFDRTKQRLAEARRAVDHALALRPDLPEGQLALGWLYWTLLDHANATRCFQRCQRHQPNDPQLWRLMGLAKMWEGDWEGGLDDQKKAMWLDPRNPVHPSNVGAAYRYLRDYEQAVPYYERAIDISPDWIVSYVELAYLYLAWKGDTGPARTCLERATSADASDGWLAPLLRVQLELYDGNYEQALEQLAAWDSNEIDILHGYVPQALLRAFVALLRGEREAARHDFILAESVARVRVREQPQDARVHSALGLALAGLGRADDAIAEGRAFETLAPVNKDGIAPYRIVDLAQVYTLLGRHDAAVEQLELLLSIPGPHSAEWLAVDPTWTPLRDVPRFRSLLTGHGVAADRVSSATVPAAAGLPQLESTVAPKSIVVLPFDNLSPDPENEYFADGLTEELITDLSKVQVLRVISRTSAFAFKGTTQTVPTIARELSVRYVLEGSVRRAGSNLRITAQLIDTETDAHLWAEKYSGTVDDVFDLQEQLSRQIVHQLEVQLTTDEHRRLAARPIDDVQAHDIWLRARQSAITMTREGLDRAQQLVQDALALVGDNALLHATMGWVQMVHFSSMVEGADEAIDLAKHHAAKAMELDPDLAWAHFVAGMVHHRQGRIQEFLNHVTRALTIERDSHVLAVLGFYLPEMGKVAAGRRYAEEARARDPLSWIPAVSSAYPEIFDGRAALILDDLRASWKRFAYNEPWSTYVLGFAALQAGREDEALERFRHISACDNPMYSALGQLFAAALDEDADRVLEVSSTPSVQHLMRKYGTSCAPVASCLAHVGEHAQALDWLEEAIELGYTNHRFIGEHDRLLETLRGERRFQSLLERAREKERALVV